MRKKLYLANSFSHKKQFGDIYYVGFKSPDVENQVKNEKKIDFSE